MASSLFRSDRGGRTVHRLSLTQSVAVQYTDWALLNLWPYSTHIEPYSIFDRTVHRWSLTQSVAVQYTDWALLNLWPYSTQIEPYSICDRAVHRLSLNLCTVRPPRSLLKSDDAICCMYTIMWPPEDEHYCSKYIEGYYINKENLCIKLIMNT